MTDDPRGYLLERFRTDARTLRARADTLPPSPPPAHGPDAATSVAMAEACDEVVAMLDRADFADALALIGPALRTRAERISDPFVRSVYAGAAVRLDEVLARHGDRPDGGSGEDRGGRAS